MKYKILTESDFEDSDYDGLNDDDEFEDEDAYTETFDIDGFPTTIRGNDEGFSIFVEYPPGREVGVGSREFGPHLVEYGRAVAKHFAHQLSPVWIHKAQSGDLDMIVNIFERFSG